MTLSAAYQGKGWRPRAGDPPGTWAPWRCASEFGRLEAVLLHAPGRELSRVGDPNAVQHLSRLSLPALKRERARLAAAFRRLGVRTFEFDGAFFGPDKHNLLFARDLFFMTPAGAVISRMASAVRAGEEKHAARALAALGVPILKTIWGKGTFEGADALWLRPDLVVCGVGSRTNAEGFRQLRDALRSLGVRAVDVPMPPGVQHLLGILQVVDRDLALVRIERAPEALVALLGRLGIEVVAVPDLDEVTDLHGMNVVTVAPRRIVMPRGCPMLERLYAAAGLRVAARLDISQTARAAGGIACSVGILSRR